MESAYSALSYRYLDTAEKLGSNCLTNSKSAGLKKCQAASDKVACMRALPAAEVVGCTGAGAPHLQVKESDGLFADWTFPNIDGYALKCPILEAFAATDGHCGDLPDAKVMLGSTQREMAFFTAIQWPLFPGIDMSDWAAMKETMYRRVARLPKDQPVPKEVMAKLDSLYNNLEDYDQQAKDMTKFFSTTTKKTITKEQMMLDAMSGDASFVGNPQMIAQALVKGGRNPYVYQFSNVLSDKELALVGPGHVMDLPFIFGDLAGHLPGIKQGFMFRKEKVTFTAAEEALADQVSEYWLNFARYLDPSPQGSKLPKWSATGKGTPKWLEITSKAPVLREQAYFHTPQVNFWLQVHQERVASCLVNTDGGRVLGSLQNGVKSWLGVPYAADPTGDLRWRPPQKLAKSAKTVVADTHPVCAQNHPFRGGFIGSEENCLELDIHVAEGVTAAKSVSVYIHGGGHDIGEPSDAPPQAKARKSAQKELKDGVLVVNVAYRLGGLGYMAMPELTKESDHGTSGNYGMLDQIAALKWIQENIHNFGTVKNPRVVIHGESAGAYSVGSLLASPLAKGLFDGAGIHPECISH